MQTIPCQSVQVPSHVSWEPVRPSASYVNDTVKRYLDSTPRPRIRLEGVYLREVSDCKTRKKSVICYCYCHCGEDYNSCLAKFKKRWDKYIAHPDLGGGASIFKREHFFSMHKYVGRVRKSASCDQYIDSLAIKDHGHRPSIYREPKQSPPLKMEYINHGVYQ